MTVRARLLTAALVAVSAAPAGAQVIRYPQQTFPSAWISADAGVLSLENVDDGRTGTLWDFDRGLQYRVSLERDRGNGATIGIVGTYARLPLTYRDPLGTGGDRSAEAMVASVGALFRGGGGLGLHQVVELSAGARYYGRFEDDDSGEALAPDGDWDPTASLGYGFGYGLNERATIQVVQDAQFTFHQRERTDGVGYNGGIHNQYVTRLTIRLGFGERGVGK